MDLMAKWSRFKEWKRKGAREAPCNQNQRPESLEGNATEELLEETVASPKIKRARKTADA